MIFATEQLGRNLVASMSITSRLLHQLGARVVAAFIAVLTVVDFAAAAAPARGSPERAAILAALRPLVERDIGPPVTFIIERMNVDKNWAFVSATPTRDGRQVDWSRTKYARLIATDAMSTAILALLRRQSDGSWRVVEYDLGPTDVTWEEWISKYRLPRVFFLETETEAEAPRPNPLPQPPSSAVRDGGQSVAPQVPPNSNRTSPANADDVSRALDEALGVRRSRP